MIGYETNQSAIKEWASLFRGKYFAMIVVYADETGTHGLQKGKKEPAPGIYGFIDTPERWESFRIRWSKELQKYNVPYFHFRELHPGERREPTNPYFGWGDEKVDDFIYDMATRASCGGIPLGGFGSITGLYGGSTDKLARLGTYEKAFEQFFNDVTNILDGRFPNNEKEVSFFFDQNRNEDWISILNKVIKKWQRKDHRIGEYTPIDGKLERGMPCQAADLFAYVHRQKMETTYERGKHQQTRLLDFIISRQGYADSHPLSMYARYADSEWESLIRIIRADRKLKQTRDRAAGLPDQPYYPYEHNPILRSHLEKIISENPNYLTTRIWPDSRKPRK